MRLSVRVWLGEIADEMLGTRLIMGRQKAAPCSGHTITSLVFEPCATCLMIEDGGIPAPPCKGQLAAHSAGRRWPGATLHPSHPHDWSIRVQPTSKARQRPAGGHEQASHELGPSARTPGVCKRTISSPVGARG